MSAVLTVEDVGIAFGGVIALEGVSFTVDRGAIFAVIGPNGAGKTTLFNLIAGLYVPRSGRVLLNGADVTGLPPHQLARRGLSRTFQNLQIFFRMSAAENVMVGRHLHEDRNVFAHALALPSVHRQNRDPRQGREFACCRRLYECLTGRRRLPYGALRRLEIARALATEPSVLLLDEPAAGCNPVETEDLDAVIKTIAAKGVAVVLVEHDMRLVMKISSRIHVLNYGRTLAEGDAAAVRANPAVIAAYIGAQERTEARRAGD